MLPNKKEMTDLIGALENSLGHCELLDQEICHVGFDAYEDDLHNVQAGLALALDKVKAARDIILGAKAKVPAGQAAARNNQLDYNLGIAQKFIGGAVEFVEKLHQQASDAGMEGVAEASEINDDYDMLPEGDRYVPGARNFFAAVDDTKDLLKEIQKSFNGINKKIYSHYGIKRYGHGGRAP